MMCNSNGLDHTVLEQGLTHGSGSLGCQQTTTKIVKSPPYVGYDIASLEVNMITLLKKQSPLE